MKDPRVASAVSQWAARFVSNGVLPADFEEVTGSIERWDDWCKAWSARAALCYHFAKFAFVQDPRQMRAAHVPAQHAERLARAVPGPVELLAVEDGGHGASNRPYRYRSRTADWLADRFGLPKS